MPRLTLCFIVLLLGCGHLRAALADEIVIRGALVLERVGRYGRAPLFIDPIESLRVRGNWKAPQAGDTVIGADGKQQAWRELRAGDDDVFQHEALQGGYALATVECDADRFMILHAGGHSVAWVNGEPRAGDPYQNGYVRLPVLLKKGRNELLFHCTRGELRAKLTPAPTEPFFDPQDATTPDFIRGHAQTLPFAVVTVNPTTRPVTQPQSILPLSIRKIARQITYDGKADVVKDPATGIEFRIREPGQSFKRTFISAIDGSVQYFAVLPAVSDPASPVAGKAMVLSLHGASVEATSQADAYAAKPWCDIVCPTNRRPFGFDWEDWGRMDAMEVLEQSKALLRADPSRIYLTGHSMGGHGTWIIGALFPDRFAAIGPSAGWISFATYASTRPATQPTSRVGQLLRDAASASETAHVFPNLWQLGVYILHGAEDDNVPADQARQMVEHLSKFHRDFVYHEQPAAGHWWESSDEPGAECVDWPAMFDFFARRRRPDSSEILHVSFVTPSPAVSSTCHWITIDQQQRPSRPSSIDIRVEPGSRRYFGSTANIARLAIDMMHLKNDAVVRIELDKQVIENTRPADGRMWLQRDGDDWKIVDPPSPATKGAHRGGPFKEAFQNRFLFVYGTRGTAEETAWAIAKARFDAETWWYRGNGSVDVVADTEFDSSHEVDRNVILYGNAEMVSCWNDVLRESPVQVRRGVVQIGSRQIARDDVACLFIRPRPGSDTSSVAVIAGTNLPGMRTTDRLPVFLSGVAFPDLTVMSADVFDKGSAEVLCAGYFDNDWGLENGDVVWQDGKE